MPLRRCWIRSLPLLLLLLIPARAASAANWRDLQRVGGTAYFLVLQSSAASIERLQMDSTATGTRLQSLPLSTSPSAPLAFFVDDAGAIFVAYPDRIDQVIPHDPDPPEIQRVAAIESSTIALYGMGNFLFVVRSASGTGITVQSVDKTTKTVGALQTPSTRQGSGFAFERNSGLVFAFASDGSSVLLLGFMLENDGSVGTGLEARIPTPVGAARLFPFPDGTRVADAGGTVYSASDLLPLDSFGGAVSGLGFRGDVPIVLRGSQAVSFTNTLRQADVHSFPTTGDPAPPPLPSAILVQGDRLWAFSDDDTTDDNGNSRILQAQSFQLGVDDGFKQTPLPLAEITLANTAFTPNGVAFDDQHGVLYLLDTAHLRLFRWAAAGGELLAIELPDTPRFLAVSPANGAIYLGYNAGKVKELSIGVPGGARTPSDFIDVQATLCGLVVADARVVTCQKGASAASSTTPTRFGFGGFGGPRGGRGISASATYTSFAVDGSPGTPATGPLGSGFVWSSAARRIYFLASSGTSLRVRGPQVIALPLADDGSFGTLVSSAVSSLRVGRIRVTLALPIVPTPDGLTLLLGSGQRLDAQSLALLPDSLPAPGGAGALVDAATLGSDLWTFREVGGVAEADKVDVSGGTVDSRALFAGTPLRVFPAGQALLALGSVLGIPTPTLWAPVDAQPLVDGFHFASTPETRLFDLAAKDHSEPGSNSELTFQIIAMQPDGQVGASGEIDFTASTPPETATVDLSGAATGSGAATTVHLHLVYHDGTLNGQPFSGTTDMTLTSFDTATNALTGTQSLNFLIGRQRLSKKSAATWALPVGVDGSWLLELTVNPPSGGTITGSAELHVHPAASDSVIPPRDVTVSLSGTVDPSTGHATLSGSNDGATLTFDDLAPLARGVTGTLGVQWLGQDRSAVLSGTP